MTNDFDRAREQAELALSIADPRELHSVIAEAAMTKAIALYYDDRLTEAGALMELGLSVASKGYHRAGAAGLLQPLRLPDAERRPRGVRALLQLGVALARERGDRSWERDLLAQVTQRQIFSGEWDEALALGQTLREAAHDEATRVSLAPWPLILAARGELPALEEWCLPPAEPSEWHELALMESLGRAIALRACGRDDDAKPLMVAAVPELSRINNSTKALFIADTIDSLLDYDRPDLVQVLTPAPGIRVPVGIGGQLERARALLQLRNEEAGPSRRWSARSRACARRARRSRWRAVCSISECC